MGCSSEQKRVPGRARGEQHRACGVQHRARKGWWVQPQLVGTAQNNTGCSTEQASVVLGSKHEVQRRARRVQGRGCAGERAGVGASPRCLRVNA